MEFPIEIGAPGFTSEPAPSAPASVNQAHEAANIEYAKVLSDPTHPHFAGFRRGEKAAEAYVDALYKKAFPDAAPVQLGNEGPSATSSLTDDRTNDESEAMELAQTRDDWATEGIEYEAGLQEAKEMAQVLYAADPKLYQEVARRVGDGLGLRVLRLLRQRVNLT